jgi:phage-related protein
VENKYFTKAQFNENFGKEMNSAAQVFEQRTKSGINDWALATYDCVFISDAKSKTDALGDFLSANYGYRMGQSKQVDQYWEISGDATEFPVDETNLMYWALDLYCKGYEFDCRLDGYGAMSDPENQQFPNFDIVLYDKYFDLAMAAYDKRNLGMAFVNFSIAIKIKPANPNPWYSRAIVKDE